MEPRHLAPDTDEEENGQDRLFHLRQFFKEQRRLAILLVIAIFTFPILVFGSAMLIDSSNNQPHYDRGYNDGLALNRDIAPKPPQQVTVVAVGNCNTPKANFMVRVGGLTPLGAYKVDLTPSPGGSNITVDSVHDIDKADDIGNATFYFNCFDRDKAPVLQATYTITVTDEQTRMSGLTQITVVLQK